jgi:hypothetical protein
VTVVTTQPRESQGVGRRPAALYGLLAEFYTPGAVMHAAEKVRDAGFRWWDVLTPFPVHGMDRAMGVRPTILPVLVFMAGLTGCALGFLLQAFTNGMNWSVFGGLPGMWVTGYKFMISGKPFISVPTFIPVMFELTILLAAVGCVLLMLLLNGLPRLHHPLFASERFRRVTDDRFFIVIEARDPKFSRTKAEALLRSAGAVNVEAVEE